MLFAQVGSTGELADKLTEAEHAKGDVEAQLTEKVRESEK